MRRGLLALAALIAGCAPPAVTAYERAARAAERAHGSGRYSESAEHWTRAAAHADSEKSRNEAHYRAAASWERAGDVERATAAYSAIARSKGDRAARARYALAEQRIEAGDVSGGQRELERFVQDFPESGLAAQALRRHAAWLWDSAGAEAALAYVRAVALRAGVTALGEHAGFELARLLERHGRLESARDQYLMLAGRFPYPSGALWDDALYRASELDERLGNPRAAVQHLERMLEQRESAFMMGSYERPRYDRARYRIAELHRDRLRDPAGARRHFQRLFDEFPNSLLRDDALWNAALLARRAGDSDGACGTLAKLAREHPDSRYVPCGRLLCSSLAPSDRACRGYIRDQIQGASLPASARAGQ